MNLRWLLFDYADPALPLSFWKRQKLIWRPVMYWKLPRSLKHRRILFAALFGLPQLIIIFLLPRLLAKFIGPNQESIWLFALAIFPIVLWIWSCFVYGLTLRPEHYYRIRLEGYDVCLNCGYWLRGLDETIKACPECGTDREAFGEDK